MKLIKFHTNRSIEDAREIAMQRILDAKEFYEKFSKQFFYRNCPCCSQNNSKKIDKFIGLYDIEKCRVCGMVYVNPVPQDSALGEYYSHYKSNKLVNNMHNKRANSKQSDYINDDRIKTIEAIFNILKKDEIRILEAGSCPGVFLQKLKTLYSDRYNLVPQGIDLNLDAVTSAKRLGLNVTYGNIENIIYETEHSYDLIMHFELIEHLIDPTNFLKNCFRLLNDGGFLFFSTSNIGGLDNVALDYNYPNRMLAHSIFPPFHLNGYSTQTVQYALMQEGFIDIKTTTPGKLDIDLLRVHETKHLNSLFKKIAELPEECLVLIQETIAYLNASGHMLVVAKKELQ